MITNQSLPQGWELISITKRVQAKLTYTLHFLGFNVLKTNSHISGVSLIRNHSAGSQRTPTFGCKGDG